MLREDNRPTVINPIPNNALNLIFSYALYPLDDASAILRLSLTLVSKNFREVANNFHYYKARQVIKYIIHSQPKAIYKFLPIFHKTKEYEELQESAFASKDIEHKIALILSTSDIKKIPSVIIKEILSGINGRESLLGYSYSKNERRILQNIMQNLYSIILDNIETAATRSVNLDGEKEVDYFINLAQIDVHKMKFLTYILKNAYLRYANFEEKNFIGQFITCKECDLRDASFKNVLISRLTLQDSNLKNANLENLNSQLIPGLNKTKRKTIEGLLKNTIVDLKDSNLEGANLKNANLKNANLIGANIKGCNIDGTIFEGAKFISAFRFFTVIARQLDKIHENIKSQPDYSNLLIAIAVSVISEIKALEDPAINKKQFLKEARTHTMFSDRSLHVFKANPKIFEKIQKKFKNAIHDLKP